MAPVIQQVHRAGNVLKLPFQLARRHPVAGENVNENTLMVLLFPFKLKLQERRMILSDFCKTLGKIRVCPNILKNISFRRSLIPDGKQLLIILPGHHYINVIIPRDKAFMTYSSNQGAIGQGVPQAIFRTDFMNHVQDFLLCCPDLLNLVFYTVHHD